MADDDGWAQLQAGSSEPTRKRPRRRALTALVVVVVAVSVLVGGLFLAESIARGIAEDAVTDAVESNLPPNVDGTVDVDIAGDWVLFQLLSGRMDEVTLSSDDVLVDGIPVEDLTITASGVPIDTERAVDAIDATVVLDEPALNELLTLPGNDPVISLGDDTVDYEDATTVFGVRIGYLVTASLAADGTDVLLTAEGAEVTSALGSLDVSGLVDRLIGSEPVRICLADRLPVGVSISGIDVDDGLAALSFEASDFVLSDESFRSTGECPA